MPFGCYCELFEFGTLRRTSEMKKTLQSMWSKVKRTRQGENESWRGIIQLEGIQTSLSCFQLNLPSFHFCTRAVCFRMQGTCVENWSERLEVSSDVADSCFTLNVLVSFSLQCKRVSLKRAAFGTMTERATSETGIKKDKSMEWAICCCQMEHVTVAIFLSIEGFFIVITVRNKVMLLVSFSS